MWYISFQHTYMFAVANSSYRLGKIVCWSIWFCLKIASLIDYNLWEKVNICDVEDNLFHFFVQFCSCLRVFLWLMFAVCWTLISVPPFSVHTGRWSLGFSYFNLPTFYSIVSSVIAVDDKENRDPRWWTEVSINCKIRLTKRCKTLELIRIVKILSGMLNIMNIIQDTSLLHCQL